MFPAVKQYYNDLSRSLPDNEPTYHHVTDVCWGRLRFSTTAELSTEETFRDNRDRLQDQGRPVTYQRWKVDGAGKVGRQRQRERLKELYAFAWAHNLL